MGPTNAATASEKRWQEKLRGIGCVCCLMRGYNRQAEIHHIVEGRKRLGQRWVLPLCEWHHRGVVPCRMSEARANNMLGPSLAGGKKLFNAEYGTERELLAVIIEHVGGPE